jgi:hypothetical protein
METMEKRTARGKVVGAYRPPLDRYEAVPSRYTDHRFGVTAPSGAEVMQFHTREEAEAWATEQNARWA